MTERVDVAVLGMGPGGEVAASRLLNAGRSLAVVERELIGGECAYWACIPSKTLLRPVDARSEAERAAGVSRPALDWAAVRDYRDVMVRYLDDRKQVAEYEQQGAIVVKGTGRLAGAGGDGGRFQIEVGDRRIEADHVVLATGSDPIRPPAEGLDAGSDLPVWTNREATGLTEIPGRALVVGGSAVAVELGQFLARMGTEVTLAQRGDRLVTREEPRIGELVAESLAADGIDVRLGRQVARAWRDGASTRVAFDDGGTLDVDVVVLGTGRRPRTGGLGLDAVGVNLDRGGLAVDERCHVVGAPDGVWAVGDATGGPQFTHVAKYQARVAADNIIGRPRWATYDGIPRVIFADPEIAAVGMTADRARSSGLDVAAVEVDLPAALARPWTYETEPRGRLGLLADRSRRVLIGAWAVAPLAGEWIHQAALAVRAEILIDTLLDQVAQFPTYTEGYLTGLEQLDL